ncbi:MAG TPA: hypothetical protein VK928_09155, partial [Longimicrobiales bacterium]|nr:hypothetical protein [Longimicrobiales bacterium]
ALPGIPCVKSGIPLAAPHAWYLLPSYGDVGLMPPAAIHPVVPSAVLWRRRSDTTRRNTPGGTILPSYGDVGLTPPASLHPAWVMAFHPQSSRKNLNSNSKLKSKSKSN